MLAKALKQLLNQTGLRKRLSWLIPTRAECPEIIVESMPALYRFQSLLNRGVCGNLVPLGSEIL
jgi:hypothetical protein